MHYHSYFLLIERLAAPDYRPNLDSNISGHFRSYISSMLKMEDLVFLKQGKMFLSPKFLLITEHIGAIYHKCLAFGAAHHLQDLSMEFMIRNDLLDYAKAE